MEIIKEIKEAEKQAKQIVEQARLDAQQIASDAKLKRQRSLEQRAQSRREAIERAENEALAKAGNEAKDIQTQAQKSCEQIKDSAKSLLDGASGKVIEFIRQMA